jgi:glucose/arabinose dehydrogenase
MLNMNNWTTTQKAFAVSFMATILLISVYLFFNTYGNIFSPSPETTVTETEEESTEEPNVTTSTLIDKLTNPWDMSFVDNDSFIYSQRWGQLRGYNTSTGEGWDIMKPADVYVAGEGGLLGVKVDVDFKNNKYIYTCMNVVGGPSISVVRWKLSDDYKSILDRKDIITGLPSNSSGRHSGCRITMGTDGVVWVGTGDIANGTLPQDPKSLGGKVLRVDRDGNPISGNMGGNFDPRIFSYGHRNVQGITLFDKPKDGVYGYTLEQGSDRDDELNLLKPGNFGWDPIPGYNESRAMTDLEKFPDAIHAVWSSGFPTIATSGVTIVKGEQWGTWNGAVLLAVQKDMHVRIQKYDADYKLLRNDKIFTGFGRIRTVVESPSGNELYLLTDNGVEKDMIIKVSLVRN